MKVLLLGKNGQLGWELQRTLAPLGEVLAIGRDELDLVDSLALERLVHSYHPQIIANASAYTAVDLAEQESDLAFQINGGAPGVMAEAARALHAVLIHFSTDYVFDGAKGTPYVEEDSPNPLNTYGRSKLEGERAIQQAGDSYIILRTSWVYSLRGDNFVTKVLSWARKNTTLRVVSDQVGSPTWARMLAEVTAQVLARGDDYVRERSGLYHLAGSGSASRFDWAQAILRADPQRGEQVVQAVQPAASADFPTPARRPACSALDCERFAAAFELRLPNWEEALRLAMEAA